MTTLQQDTNATLVWPITQQGRQIAHRMAQSHRQLDIAERVRRNTLAVWVVHDFLRALGIATDPARSDSWNPALNLMEDIADLYLPGMAMGVDRLECRPVMPAAAGCPIPAEARAERAGYVLVMLDETAGEATLLGFTGQSEPEPAEISLDGLQPMADLPDYLYGLAQPSPVTRLGQWLEGTVEAMWQSVDELLAPQTLQPAFRQLSEATPLEGLRRAKRLVLDTGTVPSTVIVLVMGVAAGKGVVELLMQLYPARDSGESAVPRYLPDGITVEILDASDTVVLMDRSQATDNALQVSFDGELGETFSLRIGWQSAQLIERFVI